MPPEVRITAMLIMGFFAAVFLAAGMYAAYKENTGPSNDNGWVPAAIFCAVMCFLCLGSVASLAGIKLDG